MSSSAIDAHGAMKRWRVSSAGELCKFQDLEASRFSLTEHPVHTITSFLRVCGVVGLSPNQRGTLTKLSCRDAILFVHLVRALPGSWLLYLTQMPALHPLLARRRPMDGTSRSATATHDICHTSHHAPVAWGIWGCYLGLLNIDRAIIRQVGHLDSVWRLFYEQI